MTVTGNCPAECPQRRKAACLVHDKDVPEVVLAEKLRGYLATMTKAQSEAAAQALKNRFRDVPITWETYDYKATLHPDGRIDILLKGRIEVINLKVEV